MDNGNTLTLKIIKSEIAPHNTQQKFLQSVFPDFLKEESNNLLYFIFPVNYSDKSDKNSARTRSQFMNGNHEIKKNNRITRHQQDALSFLALFIRTKGNFKKWVDFLRISYKHLNVETIKKLSLIDKDCYDEDFGRIIFSENDPYYLLLYLVFWSVFGEQIGSCEFRPGYFYATQNDSVTDSTYSSEDAFLELMFSKEIELIELAYHSAYKWLYSTKRINWLKNYLKKGGKLHVVVNTPEAAEIIARHLRDDEKSYISFNESIEEWRKFEKKHIDSVKLSVSDIPLMHSYTYFQATESSQSKMMIIFYTYDNPLLDENFHLFLDYDSPHFKLFKKEFEYLFNK